MSPVREICLVVAHTHPYDATCTPQIVQGMKEQRAIVDTQQWCGTQVAVFTNCSFSKRALGHSAEPCKKPLCDAYSTSSSCQHSLYDCCLEQ
jgi:hypothetical protein